MRPKELLIALPLLSTLACDGDTNTTKVTEVHPTEETTVYQEADAKTCDSQDTASATMLRDWYRADVERTTCMDRADDAYADCRDADGDDCGTNWNIDVDWCSYFYAGKINQQPSRECGEMVFDLSGNPDDETFEWEISNRDPDGDGITTQWEYLMGYNPCAEVSYYSEECLTDGEYDYDGDGILNGEDEYPYCSETDPNSDCI